MSDLQSLKSRIKNIKNTSKVTKAMKLIAANKLKKAVKDLQNFHETKLVIDHLFYKMVDNDNIAKLSENYQKLLQPSDKISSLMLIVISSNKGLCGNFNSSLFKTIENEITMLLKEVIKLLMRTEEKLECRFLLEEKMNLLTGKMMIEL